MESQKNGRSGRRPPKILECSAARTGSREWRLIYKVTEKVAVENSAINKSLVLTPYNYWPQISCLRHTINNKRLTRIACRLRLAFAHSPVAVGPLLFQHGNRTTVHCENSGDRFMSNARRQIKFRNAIIGILEFDDLNFI